MSTLFLGISILVQGGKQYHRYIRINLVFPTIETYHHIVRCVHQIVESDFERLLECEKLTLVGAGVVTLTLARSSPYQVRMNVVTVASDIGCFLNVFRPIAPFLACIDEIDTHHAVLASVRVHVVTRNPYLAAILDATDKIADVLFLLLETLQLLHPVGNILFSKNVIPIVLMHLYLILDRGMVLQLRFLADADEPLDVEPITTEDGGIVRHGINLTARSRETYQYGELAFLGPFESPAVRTRSTSHEHLQFAERVVDIQQSDSLHLLRLESRQTPVSIVHMIHASPFVRTLEAAITNFLVAQLVDLCTIFRQDDDRHGKEEILHVRSLLQHERRKVVAEHPTLDILVLGRFLRLHVHVLLPCSVASEDIEQLVLRHHFIAPNHSDDFKRQLIVGAEIHILLTLMTRHR